MENADGVRTVPFAGDAGHVPMQLMVIIWERNLTACILLLNLDLKIGNKLTIALTDWMYG